MSRSVRRVDAWEDGRGFAVPNLYTRITRAYSRLRAGALVSGEYYRSESDAKVYRFDGTRLLYQGSIPSRAAVILVPDQLFERLGRRFEQPGEPRSNNGLGDASNPNNNPTPIQK